MVNGKRYIATRIDRWLELLVVWVLAVSVLGLLSALAGHFLAPQVCLVAILLTGVYARYAKPCEVLSPAPDWLHLVLLTLLCLFFRVPAYHYVLGGQDQGIYVNMAHNIARTGAIEVRDEVAGYLDEPELREKYLEENQPATYLPGVYVINKNGADLAFQFYHLFPVWMAFFQGLFGVVAAVYALTFFSWLSIVFFYRLALAMSGSPPAAVLAGSLLAVNPLHAFFSKFPVTEVPAFAFSLIGFTFIAMYRSNTENPAWRWLWVSVAGFACLFVTRISGFMYVPFVALAAVASAAADSGDYRRRGMFVWALAIVATYAVSVWYGLRWSEPYALDIYRLSFERIFQGHWRSGVALSVMLGLAVWFTLALLLRSESRRQWVTKLLLAPLRRALAFVVLIGLAVSLLRIFRLGWTDHYLADPWLGIRWHLAGQGWNSAQASSLYALLVYLGPIFPIGLLALLQRIKNPNIESLRIFVAGFFVYASVLLWSIPYGPYYTRYLLSEVVPYMILLVVMVWAVMRASCWRKAIGLALGVSVVYMAVASTQQLGRNEGQGIYQTLQGLLGPVGEDDLLLMTTLAPGWPASSQIKTPVVYTFGRKVVSVSDESLRDHAYIASLDARFDNVFLLSVNPLAPKGFVPEDNARLKVWAFQRSFSYPHIIKADAQKRLFLYRLVNPVFPLAQPQTFGAKGAWNHWLASGWSTPEAWGTWSSGKHAELQIDARELPDASEGIRLHIEANALTSLGQPHQRIRVTVNGAEVARYEVALPESAVAMDIDLPPGALGGAKKITIGFNLPDAVSPRNIGLGKDDRVLALGLKNLTAYPLSRGGGD